MKTVAMPKMGDSMEQGKILHWIKQEGDQIARGEPLAEVETDKVNIEIEAFASGVLHKILVPAGSSALIGAPIALIGAPGEPLPHDLQSSAPAGAVAAPEQNRIFISPIARRLAAEHQLDYTRLSGTGPNGRIIKLDIESALTRQTLAPVETVLTQQSVVPAAQPAAAGQPAAVDTDDIIEIPLTPMRRAIATRLSQSMQVAPHFYMTSVIDTSRLADLRRQINAYAATEPTPIKVSFNDLIIKAVARALVRMPQVNVSFAGDKLLQKQHIHIGVAVALEQGLIVPVLHHADQLGILDIARATQRLAEAARSGKLRPEDLSGGTFTISNLGMFDVESFTAVINPPESAILAVGSITPTPVVIDGQIVVRDRVKVTLSSDHRALDGVIAARFLQEVKRLLEEPFGLLL